MASGDELDAGDEPDDPTGEVGDDDGDEAEAWDAHDERRQRDQMAPPLVPCECYCLHCGRVFMSDRIWLQRVVNGRDGFDGFWMCPTPNCGGAGFTFDIFPTDPDHPANAGWHYFGDDEGDEEGEGWEDDEASAEEDAADGPGAQYDPNEPFYKELDAWIGGDNADDDDLEGEEWKLGLAPGERPKVEPPPPGVPPRNQAEEEALYDAPDRRPREVDWSDREPPTPMGDDDIPF